VEYQFHATSLLIKQQKHWVICRSGALERVFFTMKNSSLQDVTITVQRNDSETPLHFNMPTSYTIDDVGAEFIVIKD
jgi:hypothetical protein